MRSASKSAPKSAPAPDPSFRPKTYRWRRKDGEEEAVIARIVFSTTPREVLTLRASRSAGGRIRYRMVVEDASRGTRRAVRMPRRSSVQPLSLGEVVEMLDSACYAGPCGDEDDQSRFSGVIWGTLQLRLDHGADAGEGYLGFATITSESYPQLEAHYLERLGEWCLANCIEEADCRRIVRMQATRR